MKKKKNIKKVNISKIILGVVGAAGIISLSLIAPNAVQILDVFRHKKGRRGDQYYIRSVFSKLTQEGFISIEETPKGKRARLTDKGINKLAYYELNDFKLPKPKKWDGKYRIIIFDIHEYKRRTRDLLRACLSNMGFVRLQNSVWVYPYDCRELIILLKASFEIGKDVLYIEASSIENDMWLRKHFQL